MYSSNNTTNGAPLRKRGNRGGRGHGKPLDHYQQNARPEPMSPPKFEVKEVEPCIAPLGPNDLRIPRVFAQHTKDHIIRAFDQKNLADVLTIEFNSHGSYSEAVLTVAWRATPQALELATRLDSGKSDVKLFNSRDGYWFLQPVRPPSTHIPAEKTRGRFIHRGIIQATQKEQRESLMGIISDANAENMQLRYILDKYNIDINAEFKIIKQTQKEYERTLKGLEEGEIDADEEDEEDEEDEDEFQIVM